MSTKAKKAAPPEHWCIEYIRGRNMWSFSYRCNKRASYERDGKWYCGTHDPVRVKAKREERDAKWNEKWKAESARNRLRDAAPDMEKLLRRIGCYIPPEGPRAEYQALLAKIDGEG